MEDWVGKCKNLKIELADVGRAHFHARAIYDMYKELPEERKVPGKCGKLRYNLYGTRNAAQDGENLYGAKMEEWGFRRGQGCRVTFVNREKKMVVVVHGDDFICLWEGERLDWFKAKMAEAFPIQYRGRLGGDPEDDKCIKVLNRAVEWG